MTTWQIIKETVVVDDRKGSFARTVQLNLCGALMARLNLAGKLQDREEAVAAMNSDPELREAILYRAAVEELRKAGILT